MRRGDLVTVALQGDQGKLRPALVIQSDLYDETGSVTVLPITSTMVEAPLLRFTIGPSAANGLTKPSQVMVEKAQTPSRGCVGQVIVRLDDADLSEISGLLTLFLGLA